MLLLVYDTLFQLDTQNVPTPWMVESYEVDALGLQWSFTLHEGLQWHDGRPLTADDVKFSYEYYRDNRHSRWTRAVRPIQSIEVLDDRSFTFTLGAPVPSFLMAPLADVPIIPRHVWEHVTDPNTFEGTVGSGPFKLAGRVANQSYRLVANADYFKGHPGVDEILISVIPDQTATFTALQVGSIDAAARALPPELVEQFRATSGVKVDTGPGFVSTLLQINHERPPFDNVRFRQAIALAIDPQELVDTVMLGFATTGSPGFVHPAHPAFNSALTHVTDRDRARALLDQLGYRDTNGDGVREANGRPLEFQLLVYSTNPIRIRSAEIIARWLGDIGLKATVKALDNTTVDALVWPEFDVAKGRDFDLAMWGWSAPVMLDPARIGMLFHSSLTDFGFLNIGAYSDSRVDALAEQLSQAVDPERQADLLRQIQALVAETVPFITLFYQDGVYTYRPEAYDGWVYTNGQGILGKLSFVGFEGPPAPGAETEGGGTTQAAGRSSAWLWIVLAAAVVLVAARAVRRRAAG